VIINRFGLEGGRVFTLKEIGEKLGVSRERVRQIESQAKKRLKKVIGRQQRTDASAPKSGRRRKPSLPRVEPAHDVSH
jgi:DNA-directed RNA polymerase sigma subunit (sigma70/sigma32)